jgi:signal transduction histidine kinase
VLAESEQEELLIDALLTLAQGQRGLDHREVVDLASVASAEWTKDTAEGSAAKLDMRLLLEPAPVSGDPRLIGRLVSNLLENALRHNVVGGLVEMQVARRDGHASLLVTNSGPTVPAAQLPRLLMPFQRMSTERTSNGSGLGLGLSIVAAIAEAHQASLRIEPRAEGGLEVEVRFPGLSPAEAKPHDGDVPALQAAG